MGRFGILLGLPFKRRGQYVDINGMYPGISRPVQGKWVFGALVEPDRRLGCAGGLGIRPWRRIGGLAWLGCRLYGGSGFLDRYGGLLLCRLRGLSGRRGRCIGGLRNNSGGRLRGMTGRNGGTDSPGAG